MIVMPVNVLAHSVFEAMADLANMSMADDS
jgi:hypothetical protein